MKKQEKYKNKTKLILYFDTETGIENFIAWYIDGGGEQYSKYYTKDWDKIFYI